MSKKVVHEAGKRKEAVARTTVKKGNGNVRINSIPIEHFGSQVARWRIKEALLIASDYLNLDKLDILTKSEGGGFMGQADAIASSIARSLVEWSQEDGLLQEYLDYDRTLIAGDDRRTEPHKPSQSSKGPRHKRQKSYR